MAEPVILSINERWYPTPTGLDRRPVTVVLVAGDVGDYAAYAGIGTKADALGIARHGDKAVLRRSVLSLPGRARPRALPRLRRS